MFSQSTTLSWLTERMQISLSLVELIKINGNFVALLNIVTLTLNVRIYIYIYLYEYTNSYKIHTNLIYIYFRRNRVCTSYIQISISTFSKIILRETRMYRPFLFVVYRRRWRRSSRFFFFPIHLYPRKQRKELGIVSYRRN